MFSFFVWIVKQKQNPGDHRKLYCLFSFFKNTFFKMWRWMHYKKIAVSLEWERNLERVHELEILILRMCATNLQNLKK